MLAKAAQLHGTDPMLSALLYVVVQVRVVKESDPWAEPMLLRPRETGVEYFVDHGRAGFYIVTNADGAVGYKVVLVREGASDWSPFYSPSDHAAIEDMDLFDSHCVLYVAGMVAYAKQL